MFVAGQSLYASLVFSFLSYLVAVPSAIKVFNWTMTMHRGSIFISDPPMLYALGFIGLFTIGGLTGLFLAALSVWTYHVYETYFVVAHRHIRSKSGAWSPPSWEGLHYWWPKILAMLFLRSWDN